MLIGFVSGFASETILVKLRQAGEAVVGKQPAKTSEDRQGTATGDGLKTPEAGPKTPEDAGAPTTTAGSSGQKEKG